MKEHFCAVCKGPAAQCCSNCNTVYYCSKEHQKIDWKNGHKACCAPFRIDANETLGRHLVATRKIKEGEVILRKSPLLSGPKMASYPMCLGCNKKLDVSKPFYKCTKCKWPVCGEACETSSVHKHECEIFAKSDYKPKVESENSKQAAYSIILPLRALLLKNKHKSKYDELTKMQSHLEEHKKSPVYAILKMKLIPFIKAVLKMDVNEEEILNICSIFDTNAFDVRDTEGLVNVRGIYPTAALMAHDCKHNSKHSFHGDDFQILVTATEQIEKGHLVTTSYTQTLWGTIARRSHLRKSKMFDCVCERCKDPTEFGTYAGSIFCSICRKQDKSDTCSKMISSDPLDSNANWKCEKCDHTLAAKQINWGNEAIRKEIVLLDKSHPRNLEEFLLKYEDLLHPNNYHCLEIKYALSQMYGNADGFKLTGKTTT